MEQQETKSENQEQGDSIKIVVISDTHSQHYQINVPDGDILIHAGDFSYTGAPQEVQEFVSFLKIQPHQHKIVIAGNHDLTLDEKSYDKLKNMFHPGQNFDTKAIQDSIQSVCTYLEDQEIELYGYQIYGSPHTPIFYDWAFMKSDKELEAFYKDVPECDILITHGPPYGINDQCVDKVQAGCKSLLNEVTTRIKPIVHLFGHIHEAYGQTIKENTVFINASTCNYSYRPDNPVVVFTLPIQDKSMSKEAIFKQFKRL